jgi:hypothetical protein
MRWYTSLQEEARQHDNTAVPWMIMCAVTSKGSVPGSPTSWATLDTDVNSSEAEDHRRVLVLRPELVAAPLELRELKNREATLMVPLAFVLLAEDMLFFEFPSPPLPATP